MLDVIIIGAGPAGSSAAREIAQDGWRVALLERGAYAGQRTVCGGGIEGEDAEEINLPEHLIHKRITRREHHYPWGITTVTTPHVTTMRRELDRWLADTAVEAGAKLMTQAQASRVTRRDTGQVEVVVTDLSTQRQTTRRARLVIFADGPNTLAPRSGNLGFVPRPTTTSVGLIYELAWPSTRMDHYEVHFGAQISPWGYIWIFPKRDLLNVGITILPSRGASRHLEARLRAFVESRPELRERPIVRRAGGRIPVAPAARIYDDSMLAVGDAAGMVEALTEAGIANGVMGGRLAGQVANEALAAGDLSAVFLSRYQKRWQATPRYRMIRLQSRFSRAFLPFSRFDGNLFAKLMQVLFMGGQLSRGQKLRLLAYPLLKPRSTSVTRSANV